MSKVQRYFVIDKTVHQKIRDVLSKSVMGIMTFFKDGPLDVALYVLDN